MEEYLLKNNQILIYDLISDEVNSIMIQVLHTLFQQILIVQILHKMENILHIIMIVQVLEFIKRKMVQIMIGLNQVQ